MSEPPEPSRDAAEPTNEPPRCYCPLDGVVDLLSRKYAIQVVCVVGALEPVRYGEIETAFGGVSSSTLSTRLGELTDAGLLARDQHDTIPPQVEYSLTDDGKTLCGLLEPLLEWAESWDENEGENDE